MIHLKHFLDPKKYYQDGLRDLSETKFGWFLLAFFASVPVWGFAILLLDFFNVFLSYEEYLYLFAGIYTIFIFEDVLKVVRYLIDLWLRNL